MSKNLHAWLIFMMIFSSSGLGGCTYEQKYPRVTVEIQVSEGEKEELINMLTSFSSERGFSVEDFSKNFPSGTETTFYDLKNSEGILIRVNDLISEKSFVISFFGSEVDKVNSVVEPLVSKLKDRWPDTITVKKIDAPDEG
jgi:hypothetical protein